MNAPLDIKSYMLEVGRRARVASRELARAAMAQAVRRERGKLLAANADDAKGARVAGKDAAFIDRLTLTEKSIESMAQGLEQVAKLPDPVGEITELREQPSGIRVGKMRVPLGVIGIIYESRPNVTADAAALCLKAGNAVILRGGSEAINSNLAIAAVLQGVLKEMNIPMAALSLIPFTEREGVLEMLKQEESIDLIIPRGGESLIRFVVENSRIPVIKHYKGVCHIFVDQSADFDKAEQIIINSKTQRPGVCNALETLLIHRDVAAEFIPRIAATLSALGVELRGDEA